MATDPAGQRRLGAAVRSARKRRGFRETTDWAAAVGRSGRSLLGFERGESMGDETRERIELALGWPPEVATAIVSQQAPTWWSESFDDWLTATIEADDYKSMRDEARRVAELSGGVSGSGESSPIAKAGDRGEGDLSAFERDLIGQAVRLFSEAAEIQGQAIALLAQVAEAKPIITGGEARE